MINRNQIELRHEMDNNRRSRVVTGTIRLGSSRIVSEDLIKENRDIVTLMEKQVVKDIMHHIYGDYRRAVEEFISVAMRNADLSKGYEMLDAIRELKEKINYG